MSVIKNIPKHWQVKKLGEVADYLNGRAFKPNEWERTGKPIIRIQNLNKEAAVYNYTSKEFEDKYKIEKGDLLYAWSASLGVYIWNGDKAWLNQHIFKVVPKNNCDKKYLFYTLEKITVELYAKAHGSGMVHVTKGKFEETKIPFPLLPEQQAIVSKIEELLSDLENGKQQLQTAQQQLKVCRQSLLKWAFEGKLSAEWRQNQKSLISSTELLKRIQSGKEKTAKASGKKIKPLTPITDNERAELPELPPEWTWVKLGDNAFVTKLAGFEFTKFVKYKDVGDIPVIRAQNVSRYTFIPRNFLYVDREIMEKLPRSRVFGGEILMVFVGAGLGNVGIVPNKQEYFLGPNVAKIALENQFANKFIFHFLTSQMGFANVTGMSKATAQGSISMANIREVSVPLISIEEQNYIVSELEAKLTVCDKIEETISQSLQQAETLRQSILKKAFEGKLVQTEEFTSKKKELA